MSDEHKIYDIFRKNEHKLAEKPSPKAWERLNARLDENEQQKSHSLWWYGGMVAACVLIVGVAGLLLWDGQILQNDAPVAERTEAVLLASAELEDFTTTADIEQYRKMVAYQLAYQELEERIKEMVIAGNFTTTPTTEKAEVADAKTLDETPAETKTIQPTPTVPIQEERQQTADEPAIAMLEEEAAEEVASPQPPTKNIEELALLENDETPIMDESVSNNVPSIQPSSSTLSPTEEVLDDDTALAPAPRPASIMPSKELAMEEEYQLNEESGITMDEKELGKELQLEGLEWLLGKWTADTPNGISQEVWRRKDAATLQGKAQLTAGGVTLMTEQMLIWKTTAGVYLSCSIDGNAPKTYRLSTQKEGRMVFKNETVAYPQQIILEQKGTSYSLQMQQGDTTQVKPQQWEYLQQRNTLKNDASIQRQLRREE